LLLSTVHGGMIRHLPLHEKQNLWRIPAQGRKDGKDKVTQPHSTLLVYLLMELQTVNYFSLWSHPPPSP